MRNLRSSSKLLLLLVSLLPTLLSKRQISHFRKSFKYGCYFHPADPNPHNPTCLPKERPESMLENCQFHLEGICLECSNRFFLSFPDMKCRPCAKGCKKCEGPLEKDCFHLDNGYRFNLNSVRIEGCHATEENPLETGGCHDCHNPLGICILCEKGYAEIPKFIRGVTEDERDELRKKVDESAKNDPDFKKKVEKMEEDGKLKKGSIGKNHPDKELDEELRDFGRRRKAGGEKYYQCVKCKEGCVHCYNDMICTECSEEYQLVQGTCLKSNKKGECKKKSKDGRFCFDCPEGQNFSFQKRKCVTCPKECSSCHTSAYCTSCKPGYRLSGSGICAPCKVPGCLNCFESERTCLGCIEGFYFSLNTQMCEKCHDSCATCTGPREKDCLSCRMDKMKVEYHYENLPSAIAQKQLHNFEIKYPEYSNMHMLQRYIFHPEWAAYCKDFCVDIEDLHKRQGMFEKDRDFTNECPIIYSPHPQELYSVSDEVKFEYGGHHTDEDAEAQYEQDIHKKTQRERIKKHVEKELTKEGHKRAEEAINRHNIGRKNYKKLVEEVKEKHRDITKEENKMREEYLKTKIPHSPGDAYKSMDPDLEPRKHTGEIIRDEPKKTAYGLPPGYKSNKKNGTNLGKNDTGDL